MDDLTGAARAVLATVFMTAGWAKLSDRAAFRTAVRDLGVPAFFAPAVALSVPLVELAIGVAVLVAATTRQASVVAVVLLSAFSVLLAGNLLRGNRPDCNCFGQIQTKPIGPASLVRNLAIVLLAVLVAVRGPGRFVGAWIRDATALQVVALVGVTAVAILGYLVLQLTVQQGRLLIRLDELDARIDDGETGAHGRSDDADRENAFGLPVGTAAPTFRLPSLNDQQVTLEALTARGLPVILVFVSSHCAACHSLLPEVAEWQRQHAQMITVAAIGSGDDHRNRQHFVEAELADALFDESAVAANAFRYNATPCAVLIDSSGMVASPLYTGADGVRSLVEYAAQRAAS